MRAVKRLDARWEYYNVFDRDVAQVTAFYEVEGIDKQLEVRSEIAHDRLAVDEEGIKARMLEMMDREAQWAADHPDLVPTISPKLVCDD